MNQDQALMEESRRLKLTKDATFAEFDAVQETARIMFETLGMSPEDFKTKCSSILSPQGLKEVEASVRETEAWILETCQAVANPAGYPMQHIDVKALRRDVVKRKFV